MANTTQEVVKYEVCFVQTGSSSEEATEVLKLAFEAMDSNQLEPKWITTADCLNLSKREPKLFVLDPFDGEAFEHMKTVQCRIVGPLCILYCLQYSDVLPKRSYPVYSVSMRKITVSCSNIPANIREEISTKIQLMGGFFSKDLTKSVTHLVVGEVGSQKYKVAANFGLPIMVPEWITDVWENGQYKQLHASDGCYDKYKCPVFKGLVITVSQLSTEERLAIKTVIEKNGGSYSGALKANETTHLILSEPSGDKYRFAKTWKVLCVTVNWVHDSVEASYCRDEALYAIDESMQTVPKRSTPKKDLTTCELPLVDCSAITGNSAVSYLDETVRSDISILVPNQKNSYLLLDEFNLSNLPKYGQFLDGCKIYLTGFNSVQMDKLRKIVNSGSGMRFSKYSDSISHVVCGELSEDFKQSLRSSSVKPYVVNFKWLLECCKNEKLVDEKPYLCVDVTPLSPEKNEPMEMKKDISLHLSQNSQTKKDNFTHDNITDIFKQYINEQHLDDNKENNVNANSASNNSKNHLTGLKPVANSTGNNIPVVDLTTQPDCIQQNLSSEKSANAENKIAVTENEDISDSENLFSGLKFVVIGFGEKDSEILSCMIDTHSGIISKEVNSSCDIAVVPMIWHDINIPVSNVVTNCWLQKCIEDSKIYDFDENELFRPFAITTDKKPFESFVISFSQYVGTERDSLICISESLGAVCQEYFVRKVNAAKRVLANTHLVVSIPDGSKYEASKKWKIPAVTKQWVIDAARLGTAPSVEKYLVEKFPEFPTCVEEIKSVKNISKITENKNNSMSAKKSHKSSKESMLQLDQVIEKIKKDECENMGASTPVKFQVDNANNYETVKVSRNDFETPRKAEVSSIPPQHNRLAELCNESIKLSPFRSQADNSLDVSLNLDQTQNFKFHVSGILKDLDASASRESFSSSKRHSLPVEEMFSRNLASALRRFDDISFSGKETNINLLDVKQSDDNAGVLGGVVIYVSRKLVSIQTEVHETVVLLGGDYGWTCDDKCTHFIFMGKANDISKEFREARSQGKKIVAPDWLYACRDKGVHVEEELYPHTFKANMSLSQQISILKVPHIEEPMKEAEEKKIAIVPDEALPAKDEVVDFNKQLNELLVAAKSAKKRQSKRMSNSTSSSPVAEISPAQKLQRHLSDVYIKHANVDDCASQEPDTCSQHSQTYPIMWDDPTGRLEREKIAARAAKIAENLKTALDHPTDEEHKIEQLLEINCENVEKIGNSAITAVKKFMFTNINDTLKSEYIEIIKKLGGETSDEKTFDISATHLIISNPIKNEKFLSSVASGKWVLHPLYLTASAEQNKFLDETEFEWGGTATDKFMQNLSSSNIKIARCPYRWRSKVQNRMISCGAFDTWHVVIHADDKAKLATYTKILESGGAQIIPPDSVESSLDKISHVFVDFKRRNPNRVDLNCYLSRSIKCLKPEYLAFYLIEDPPPDAEIFLIPEAKEQLVGSDISSKKRNSSTASRKSKRTRLK